MKENNKYYEMIIINSADEVLEYELNNITEGVKFWSAHPLKDKETIKGVYIQEIKEYKLK